MPMPLEKEHIYTIEDYYNAPDGERFELIDGVVYDMAPPSRMHQSMSMKLSSRIEQYIREKGGPCEVYAAPFGVHLNEEDDTTIVEPDISVICDKDKLNERGCEGAPDWVIEITSPSNAGYDYVKKLKLYLKAGVREYWIVDIATREVAVYDFTANEVLPENYSFEDKVKAGIYDDLWIDFKEISAYL